MAIIKETNMFEIQRLFTNVLKTAFSLKTFYKSAEELELSESQTACYELIDRITHSAYIATPEIFKQEDSVLYVLNIKPIYSLNQHYQLKALVNNSINKDLEEKYKL